MPFQLSPGVNVSEIDLTTIVPAVATTDAAFVGPFNWGPVDEITLVNNQEVLVSTFGKPTNAIASFWFTASNFLDYGNKLHLVRVVDKTGAVNVAANNATSGQSTTSQSSLLITNDTDYAQQESSGFAAVGTVGQWAANYPGILGNNIRVSICDSHPGAFSNDATGFTANTIAASNYIYVGTDATKANTNFIIGDTITITGVSGEYTIQEFPVGSGPAADLLDENKGAASIRVHKPIPSGVTNKQIDRKWQYYSRFNQAPGTSAYAAARSSANDEIHIAVSDQTGLITGVAGQLLETFPNSSKAGDGRQEDGRSSYYKDIINESSKYIRWLNDPASGDQIDVDPTAGVHDRAWGNTAFFAGVPEGLVESFKAIAGNDGRYGDKRAWLPDSKTLSGGVDGFNPNSIDNSMFQLGYDMFNDPEETDISLVLGGPSTGLNSQYIIENIAEKRKDCVAFISPRRDDCVSNDTLTEKLNKVKAFRLTASGDEGIAGISSSYGVMDSGWKYQYDKFNDQYRWVPLNADIAGLCVRTDESRDPWWSPAGFNRGHIKNLVKLAWNPQKAHRDELYKNGINPVVTIPGQGTILFGDKTLQSKPSAFDRINVRRLFIVLEKAIAIASKFTLFEFNDEFTRSQFVNMVEPFLRDVQGRRGIFDFKVVCDETNNTGEVIDRNEFIGDIYIKPARSINFIQLNFIAVRTGVDFEEVVGKF